MIYTPSNELQTKKRIYEIMKNDDKNKSNTIFYLTIILTTLIITFIPLLIVSKMNISKLIGLPILFIILFCICSYFIYINLIQ